MHPSFAWSCVLLQDFRISFTLNLLLIERGKVWFRVDFKEKSDSIPLRIVCSRIRWHGKGDSVEFAEMSQDTRFILSTPFNSGRL
jgi:hypothetical protein